MKKNSYEKSENSYDRKIEKDFENILKRDPAKLTDEELKKKIEQFLYRNRICALSTCYNNSPRSTPVRYRNKGLSIYIVTEGGGKIRNIIKNPSVSVSLFGEYSGFQSVKGLQVWGKAEIIAPNNKKAHTEWPGTTTLCFQ